MTTIAYDGYTIAADSLDCIGDEPAPYPGLKLYPCTVPKFLGKSWSNGDDVQRIIVGTSGIPSHSRKQLWHYVNLPRVLGGPMEPLTGIEGSLIVVHLDVEPGANHGHQAFLFDRQGTATDVTMRHMAIGSGADYAMGAMAAGSGAAKAVEIAGRLNLYTSGLNTISLAAPTGTMGGMKFPFYLDHY